MPLEVTPAPIDLGTLRPGETARTTLALWNPLAAPVSIARIETSCPCVETGPIPSGVGPGETVALGLVFDSSREPEFRGNLDVEIVGLGPTGVPVFQSRLMVGVSDEPREAD